METLEALLTSVVPHLPLVFTVAIGCLSLAAVTFNAWPVRPKGKEGRALLVIAHPDDEAMFFLPAIRSAQQAGYSVDILCLSNGGGGGHGPLREKELVASAAVLGVPAEDVAVLDDPQMQDGMQTWWETDVVEQAVRKHVAKRPYELLLTFDASGISGHINHRATHQGVKAFTSSAAGSKIPCYELETVFIGRKFSSIFDLTLSWLTTVLINLFSSPSDGPAAVLAIQPDPLLSHKVMSAHWSQYAWFRVLFVVFSRHNHINTLRRIDSGNNKSKKAE